MLKELLSELETRRKDRESDFWVTAGKLATGEKVTAAESEGYFQSRPYDSRIGAAASPQSREIGSRAELEERFRALEAAHPEDVPRPEHWGGFRVVPDRFEFWQGRQSRLHDRLVYLPAGAGWRIRRLAP